MKSEAPIFIYEDILSGCLGWQHKVCLARTPDSLKLAFNWNDTGESLFDFNNDSKRENLCIEDIISLWKILFGKRNAPCKPSQTPVAGSRLTSCFGMLAKQTTRKSESRWTGAQGGSPSIKYSRDKHFHSFLIKEDTQSWLFVMPCPSGSPGLSAAPWEYFG